MKQLLPRHRKVGTHMKINCHILKTRGREFRVLKLKHEHKVRFSTNYFHKTWHLVAGRQGARALSILLWELSYCRIPNTIIAIDAPHLTHNPFDAAQSKPFFIACSELGVPSEKEMRVIKRELKRPTKVKTVKLRATSLSQDYEEERWRIFQSINEEKVGLISGQIVFRTTRGVLRRTAKICQKMAITNEHQGYLFLDQDRYAINGEIQILPDYEKMLGDAKMARKLALENLTESRLTPIKIEEIVWSKLRQARFIRRRSKRKKRSRSKTQLN